MVAVLQSSESSPPPPPTSRWSQISWINHSISISGWALNPGRKDKKEKRKAAAIEDTRKGKKWVGAILTMMMKWRRRYEQEKCGVCFLT